MSTPVLLGVSDDVGGDGGIGLLARDALMASCVDSTIERITPLLSVAPHPTIGELSRKVSGLDMQLKYAAARSRAIVIGDRRRKIFCKRVNLLPLKRITEWAKRVRILVTSLDVDARRPSPSLLRRWSAKTTDHVVAVSYAALRRLDCWTRYCCGGQPSTPHAILLERFSAKPKNPAPAKRYGLIGGKVTIPAQRLTVRQRYKGVDAAVEAMPTRPRRREDFNCLIVRGAQNRTGLELKARPLAINGNIIFAGQFVVEERTYTAHLADVDIVPKQSASFSYGPLEPVVRSIPIIASTRDGKREALSGTLSEPLVEPFGKAGTVAPILGELDRPQELPKGFEFFTYDSSIWRLQRLVRWSVAGCQQ